MDSFDFSTSSFLLNFDILEEINQEQSIGLYISDKDFQDNSIDWGFIYSATKRINKYIKKPKLYIFGPKQIKEFIKSEINFKIINNLNWKEEFYLLKECKHKIIISNRNSYSKNLWASILNKKYDGIRTYSKNEYSKNLNRNWLAI